jgi:hypothetical protein
MSPPGLSPPDRPKGKYRKAQPEGAPANGLRRRQALTLLPALWLAPLAHAHAAARAAAAPAELAGELPGARLQGSGRLRFVGLRVYDIRLWTARQPVGRSDWSVPLALEIEYARALDGRLIAERSLEEMRRLAPLAPEQAERWLAEMTRLFPDVREGDRLTGVKQPDRGVRFFHNGRLRGEVGDPQFARRFFGIWLAPQTSQPQLREQLLGLAS